MADPKTFADVVPAVYDAAGVRLNRPGKRTILVVGPAVYTAGTGIQGNASAYFSRIIGVKLVDWYTTSTGIHATGAQYPMFIAQRGTDLFSNAKWQLIFARVNSHTHTYEKADSVTGGPSAAPTAGVDAAHTHTISTTPTASGSPAGTNNAFSTEITSGDFSLLTFEFEVTGELL